MNEAAKRAQKEYAKQYREANKEKIAETKRKYYLDNKDRVKEQQRQWKLNNPEKVQQQVERYWTRKAQAAGHLCLNCNTPFTPQRSDAKYCSDKCRVTFNRNKAK